MGEHERNGESDEWYTPGWVFESLGVRFDLDPCAAAGSPAEQRNLLGCAPAERRK
jgi:hypothetical protein